MSGPDSSGDSSDGEPADNDTVPDIFSPPDPLMFSNKNPSPPPTLVPPQKQTPALSSSSSSSSKSTPSTTVKTEPSTSPSILSPILYQTPQGMMYATPSNGGVILSLAQGDANGQPQFITIPLSMMTNGQGELDLSKRN
ncbi:unnamed protein product [Brassicogethes aeneus]|uniref:Uncharacterized protein n=1 Tax=Brassicogethes aeneus TaxID=1431903 RepID=A0A9P0AZ16_BRAAE|nr:unnamed protein product [Brassicogethes aeneus]